ncbi:MAG: LLM class flavin-dependent oxidoreductase [Actinomycetota bacterium]
MTWPPPATTPTAVRIGLFLNLGANLGTNATEVVHLTLEQARRAEAAGLDELWVTEHHCIGFGINPSALTTAGFLLGRTERIRVGTAVTLAPLQHPVELAERGALLDQLSGGRFELGIGRGGYLKDYEVLDVDVARWEDEPLHSADAILRAWAEPDLARPEHDTGPSVLQPRPLTEPHPPLLLATRTPEAIRFAARHDLALQHYFASPVEQRTEIEAIYADERPAGPTSGHLHALIVVVDDDIDETRRVLAHRLTESFRAGDWPYVPQLGDRHANPDGTRRDPAAMAEQVAGAAIVGPPELVADELAAFVAATDASRLACFVEAVADPQRIHRTIDVLAALDLAPPVPTRTAGASPTPGP